MALKKRKKKPKQLWVLMVQILTEPPSPLAGGGGGGGISVGFLSSGHHLPPNIHLRVLIKHHINAARPQE